MNITQTLLNLWNSTSLHEGTPHGTMNWCEIASRATWRKCFYFSDLKNNTLAQGLYAIFADDDNWERAYSQFNMESLKNILYDTLNSTQTTLDPDISRICTATYKWHYRTDPDQGTQSTVIQTYISGLQQWACDLFQQNVSAFLKPPRTPFTSSDALVIGATIAGVTVAAWGLYRFMSPREVENVVNVELEADKEDPEILELLKEAEALEIDLNNIELECPILLTIMTDPVKAADDKTYQRSAILSAFNISHISPLTRIQIHDFNVTPDEEMKEKIKVWLREKIAAHRAANPAVEDEKSPSHYGNSSPTIWHQRQSQPRENVIIEFEPVTTLPDKPNGMG